MVDHHSPVSSGRPHQKTALAGRSSDLLPVIALGLARPTTTSVVLHHPVDHQQRRTRYAAALGADGPGNELEMVLAVGLVHLDWFI